MPYATLKQRLAGAIWPRDRLLSATSDDGLHWRRDPAALLHGDPWGTRMFYYPKALSTGSLLYPAGPASDGFAALQQDGGRWRPEDGWRFRLPAGTALKRVDGPEPCCWGPEDWRLFFAGHDGCDWRLYQARAASPDRWEGVEACLDLKGQGPLDQAKDPCLVHLGKKRLLCFTRFAPYGASVLALASEGRSGWEVCAELPELGKPGWGVRTPCAVALPGGGWRLYFSRYPLGTSRHSRLDVARSDDGTTWRIEREGVLEPGGPYDRHGLFCPSVVPEGEGWRLFYAGDWGRHLLEPLTLYQHSKRSP